MSVSLTRYLVEQQRSKGHIPSELRLLLEVVARACKGISHAVNKGALGGVLGAAHSENVQGEIQKKLESCGVVEPVGVEWAINEARTMAEETKPQKEIMMKGTSSSCVWKDPSDPVNW